MVPGEIVHDRAERDGRKIRLLVIVPGPRDKLDDVGTHWGSSHTAIAIRPISASDIRYAVIGFSLELNVRHDRWRAIISGANPYPCTGAACSRDLGHAARRHVRARRLMMISGFERRRARDAPGDGRWEMRRRDKRPPSDSKISTKKPAADFSARALHDFCDDDNVPVICPTCQMFFGPSIDCGK
jgi:hypothetical protein